MRFAWFLMEPDGVMLGELGALIDQGAIKPVIGKTFSLEQTATAYEELADGHAVGKIVVTVVAHRLATAPPAQTADSAPAPH